MMDPTLKTDLKKAADAIRACTQLAVTCHINPDGDALGSALALTLAARRQGKDVVVSFGEPFELSDSFGFLPLDLLTPPASFPARPEVVVAFDAGARYRLGGLAGPAGDAGTLIVIDHHASNEGFGDINVIAPNAGASAQLCFYLLQELGWDVDGEVATCLYTGLVTDTGRFQYASTSSEVMRVAGELLDAGVEPAELGQRLYEMVPFGYLRVASIVLGRAVLEEELGLVWSYVTPADLEEAGIGYEDADGLIDELRIAREAGVAVLLKETASGVKASLRSRGEVNVGAIATELGGGGHPLASGFTRHASVEQIIEDVRRLLRDG